MPEPLAVFLVLHGLLDFAAFVCLFFKKFPAFTNSITELFYHMRTEHLFEEYTLFSDTLSFLILHLSLQRIACGLFQLYPIASLSYTVVGLFVFNQLQFHEHKPYALAIFEIAFNLGLAVYLAVSF